MKKQNGFTLIELLVVISVIGLLASIILVSLNGARQKARMAKLQADMHQIQTQVDIARNQQNLNFGTITGQWCSPCSFNDGKPIKDPSHAAALASQAQGWLNLSFASVPNDPWGNPYLLEGNEYESGLPPCTRYDDIISGGPDGIEEFNVIETSPPGALYTELGSDDYYFALTHFQCTN